MGAKVVGQTEVDITRLSGLVAGVDEAGRGPLAGPVIAAAVILDPEKPIDGLMDSKAISEKKRDSLFEQIKEYSLSWGVGRADVAEIDEINILQASLLAMKRAVEALAPRPGTVLVDGNQLPQVDCPAQAIIKGDSKVQEISAASIIAKVTRDREMCALDKEYPGYGLAKHKGYPTKLHMQALQELGVTEIHRCSYGPIKKLLVLEN